MVDSDNKRALGLLCDLFALSTIEADRAWWMEHGRLSSQRSKAISREVSSLCRKVRPIAEDLVDGFGIPAEMLHAEILVRPGRTLMRLAGLRIPGLGGWSEDPLWATFYDWTVEHPQAGGALWKAGIGSDLRRLYAAAAEIGRQPAGSSVLDVPVRRRGRAARAAAPARACGTSPPTSPRRCSTAPWPSPAPATSPPRSSPCSPTSATLPVRGG